LQPASVSHDADLGILSAALTSAGQVRFPRLHGFTMDAIPLGTGRGQDYIRRRHPQRMTVATNALGDQKNAKL